MTDARLRGEWLTAAAHDALSDPAYRIFHNALMHAAEQGTDGAIAHREIRFLYPGPVQPEWLEELERAQFWERTDNGYQFIDWSGRLGQSKAADVEQVRAANRGRKRRQRAREGEQDTPEAPAEGDDRGNGLRPLTTDWSHRESQRLSRRDVTAGVGRTGQDRPPEGAHPVENRTRGRAKKKAHDCSVDGHKLDADGLTCLRCEYRDRDRIDELARAQLELVEYGIPR